MTPNIIVKKKKIFRSSIKMIQNIKYLKAEKIYGYDENNYGEWNFYFEVSGDLAKLIIEDTEDRFSYMTNDLESEIVEKYTDSVIYKVFYMDKDGGLEDEDAEELHTWQDTLDICADDLSVSIENESSESEYFMIRFEDLIPDYIDTPGFIDEFETYIYSFEDVNKMTSEEATKIINDIIDDCTVEFTAFSYKNFECNITGTYNTLDIFEEDFQWENNQGFLQNQFPRNPYDFNEDYEKNIEWDDLKQNLLSDGELTQILTDFCHNQDYEFERNGYTLRIN